MDAALLAAYNAGDDDEAPLELKQVIKQSGLQLVTTKQILNSVGQEREEWRTALAYEMGKMTEKNILQKLSKSELVRVTKRGVMPMMIVAGIKPADSNNYRLKRTRLVACGNFQHKGGYED